MGLTPFPSHLLYTKILILCQDARIILLFVLDAALSRIFGVFSVLSTFRRRSSISTAAD